MAALPGGCSRSARRAGEDVIDQAPGDLRQTTDGALATSRASSGPPSSFKALRSLG